MKKIIVCDGGLGDSLILIGACQDRVDVAIRPAQMPLIAKLDNVDNVFDVTTEEFRRRKGQLHEEYDQVIHSDMFLSTFDHLKKEDYYKLAAKRLNQKKAAIPKLNIPVEPHKGELRKVCIHTTATNPNRHIPESVWDNLAYSLSRSGYLVWFSGTRGDYGFTDIDSNIYKMSDEDESLLYQAELLGKSHLFIGIDSGFLHICGILGVKGYCILTNTGYNVLSRYPSITPIDNFTDDLQPTYSLQPYCEVTKQLADSITAEQICEEVGVPYVPHYSRCDQSRKLKVRVSDDTKKVVHPYLSAFDIVESDADVHIKYLDEFRVLVEVGDIQSLFMSHYLNLPRHIRNVVFAAGKEITNV